MKSLALFAMVLAIGGSALAQSSDRISIRENEVVAVKFDGSISIKSNRRGDRFTATVDDDRYLPKGTRLIGEVTEIRKKEGDQKAFADLEFTAIELPDGQKIDIQAYPIPLNDKNVSRSRGGRMEAKKATRRDHVVLGSTVGGLILGSIFKKPFEGAVIGTLAGILVAETDAVNTNGELVVQKGQKMGAAFEREVNFDWREGDRRNDRDERGDRDVERTDGRTDSGIRIEYDRETLRFESDRAPYKVGSTVMVPLAEMVAQLGLELSKTSNGVFFVEDEENTLKLEQNKSDVRLNGRRISLPREVVEKDGVTYVPIEAFAAIKRDSLYVNGQRVSSRA